MVRLISVRFFCSALMIVLLLTGLPRGQYQRVWRVNYATVVTLRGLLADWHELTFAQAALAELSNQDGSRAPEDDCRVHWLRGVVANALDQQARRNAAWTLTVRCSSHYIQMLRTLVPDDQDLAKMAAYEQPESGEVWFWLAQLRAKEDPEEAIDLYYQGFRRDPYQRYRWQQLSDLLVTLDPQRAKELYRNLGVAELTANGQPGSVEALFLWARIIGQESPEEAIELYREAFQLKAYDSIHWREFGDLLRVSYPDAAIEAYLKSCEYGDAGSNGCYRAGLTAEQLGDFQAAIRYYRLSRWSGALERADQLEQQLREQVPP